MRYTLFHRLNTMPTKLSCISSRIDLYPLECCKLTTLARSGLATPADTVYRCLCVCSWGDLDNNISILVVSFHCRLDPVILLLPDYAGVSSCTARHHTFPSDPPGRFSKTNVRGTPSRSLKRNVWSGSRPMFGMAQSEWCIACLRITGPWTLSGILTTPGPLDAQRYNHVQATALS